MARARARGKDAAKDKGMGSALAAMALSAFAVGAPAPSAQAAIPPQRATDDIQIYKIPPGSMAAALTAFADKNGLHLLYDARTTRQLKSSGLSGAYSVRQGLDRLLAGSGLKYSLTEMNGAISIVLAQNDTGTRSDAGAIALPTVDVTATQNSGTGCGEYSGAPCSGFGGAGLAQDPYNTSYVLPDASTGTKTDTPVMDTPLNVQSVSQQVLQDQQAITLGQALQNVSGTFVSSAVSSNLTGNPSAGIYIRGFLTATTYRNGFRFDTTQNSNIDPVSAIQFANIADVQVLKGPGAILYGLVDPGGIVNIVTKEPLDTPYYAVQQQVGSLALYRTTIDATGPLTEDKTWLYRMDMSYENNGAPFGSLIDLTHSQNIFLAPVIKWNIDGATWVKLEGQYNSDRTSVFQAYDPLFNGAFVNIPRSTNYGESNPNLTTNLFTALTWSHQFNNDWSIRQQFAYNNIESNPNQVLPTGSCAVNITCFGNLSNPFPSSGFAVTREEQYLQVPQRTVSTNVDITGHFNTFGAQHTLLVGGDIYYTYGSLLDRIYGDTSLIDLFDPTQPGTPFGCFTTPCFNFASSFTQETAGLYAQDQIKLPYNIYLLAGARYQYIHQTGATGSSPGAEMPNGAPLVGQAVTPRFGLLWRPQDWVSFYGNYAQGFGPNVATLVAPGVLAPPTNAESWEAGAKLEFFNGKLRVSADYFELVETNVPAAVNPLMPLFSVLAGEARSTGPELDIEGEILPGWKVIANYTNDDVRITKGGGGGGGQFESLTPGQRLPGVPRNQANFWTTYEFEDEMLRGLKIGAGYHYIGARPIFNEGPLQPFPLLSSYGTVDLMAAYTFKLYGSKVTAQLNITNLLDTTYYTNATIGVANVVPGISSGPTYRQYGAPFAAVGSLRAEF
ncbi:MAG TPA: TonB-dependent receptor [Methylocella sp.]|nr:TonB-dependent receptor [Methylocella sp.]